ncbi:MAG: hypothetical protein RBU45_24200 [Myxococcota bacterium]|jgi:hypothetical protein|nr:hypothetical protein [Myxococcota bacterium]
MFTFVSRRLIFSGISDGSRCSAKVGMMMLRSRQRWMVFFRVS